MSLYPFHVFNEITEFHLERKHEKLTVTSTMSCEIFPVAGIFVLRLAKDPELTLLDKAEYQHLSSVEADIESVFLSLGKARN